MENQDIRVDDTVERIRVDERNRNEVELEGCCPEVASEQIALAGMSSPMGSPVRSAAYHYQTHEAC